MNTPAHALLNCALLRRGPRGAVLLGALLPDLPMFPFWLSQVAVGRSQHMIWSVHYFDPTWQRFFDVFNSIPLCAVIVLAAWGAGQRGLLFGGSSALLHQLGDFLLHREDGHRHLFPISDWRFMSPISYWDPNYYGHWVSAFELAASAVAALYLYRRATTHTGRALLATVWGSLLVAFFFFYAL